MSPRKKKGGTVVAQPPKTAEQVAHEIVGELKSGFVLPMNERLIALEQRLSESTCPHPRDSWGVTVGAPENNKGKIGYRCRVTCGICGKVLFDGWAYPRKA